MSHCYNVTMIPCHNFTLLQCHIVTILNCNNVKMSYCHYDKLSHFHESSLSYCHKFKCYNNPVLQILLFHCNCFEMSYLNFLHCRTLRNCHVHLMIWIKIVDVKTSLCSLLIEDNVLLFKLKDYMLQVLFSKMCLYGK